MPKVSINILTKNRAELLQRALASVLSQSFTDYDIVVVNDGSTDNTAAVLSELKVKSEKLKVNTHTISLGITKSRQEALQVSAGEYIAILDDDDEWVDKDKLKKQVEYLDSHPEVVLVGGGIEIEKREKRKEKRLRPQIDRAIRSTMLFRNNFFTSTVMFRRQLAAKVGGFMEDETDLAEDYDLWLRLVRIGRAYNFQEVFTNYKQPEYTKEKLKQFYTKQLHLIGRYKKDYKFYHLAATIAKLRILL
jgi:glycosyltransferase involved in cell wall biosynthesis